MSQYLPINNAGLKLLAINGNPVKTAPAETINLTRVINVLPNIVGTTPALRIAVAASKNTPDTYDFLYNPEIPATATAGFTIGGAVTSGDEVEVTVDGINYTATAGGSDTAATMYSKMLTALQANTLGFTVAGSNTAGVILYTLTAPANSGAEWNTKVVNVTFVTNTGPSFATALHNNFANGYATDSEAEAGITVSGSPAAGDKWTITVNGTAYTYLVKTSDTAALIEAGMAAVLAVNSQGFTFSSELDGSVIKFYIIAKAGTGSYWNGRVVSSVATINTGSTFSAPTSANFANGSGVAEQLQAFITAQSLTSTLQPFTGVLSWPNGTPKNGPSIMLNPLWITSKLYDGTSKTVIAYTPPNTLHIGNYVVSGNQAA